MAATSRPMRLTLLATVLGSSVGFLDATVLGVALPTIAAELRFGLVGQQWVNVAYLLAMTATYLLAGAVGDRVGLRTTFAWACGAFAAASLVAGVAGGVEVLVAARVAQGIAGAFLSASSLALLRVTWAGDAGRAIGLWTSGTSLATIAGPFLGGVVTDELSWRLLFLANLPIAAVAIALAIAGRTAHEQPGDATRPLDLPGAALGAIAVSGVTFLVVQGQRDGYLTHAWAGAAGLACLAAFLVHEHRTPRPLLPLGLFAVRDFAAANLATFLVYAGLGASLFYLGLMLQSAAVGLTATQAGLATMPMSAIMVALAPTFGRVADRRGARGPIAGGALLMAGGTLAFLPLGGPAPVLAPLAVGNVVFGLGLALLVAPITSCALQSVPERMAGVAAAVNTAVARLGSVLAVAVTGAVVSAVAGGAVGPHDNPFATEATGATRARETTRAWRAGMLVPAGLLVAGSAVALVGVTPRGTSAPAPRPTAGGRGRRRRPSRHRPPR